MRMPLEALGLVLGAMLALAPANADEVLKMGTIAGAGGHKAAGTVEIARDGDVMTVHLKEDFVLQEAPTLRLAWGKDGYARGSNFATLGKFKGAQAYKIPAGTDLARFNEFWIWCEKFDVPLAVAKLR